MSTASLHSPACAGSLRALAGYGMLLQHSIHRPGWQIRKPLQQLVPGSRQRDGRRSHTPAVSCRLLRCSSSQHSQQQRNSASSCSSRGRQICAFADASANHPLDTVAVSAVGEPAAAVQPKKLSSVALRVIFGTLLGLSGAVVILLGGWLYVGIACLVAYQASQEYFGFVTLTGLAQGTQPPPPFITSLTTLCCMSLTLWAYTSNARSTAALAVASFAILSLQLLTTEKPNFAQITSSVFGLFYCGYLPSFWIKLRLLRVPAVHSTLGQHWPVMLGGVTHWTVGLIATFAAVACIIAADTGAYLFGKSMGRTQLISISPKKTVEGAVGGLLCSITCALALQSVFRWPASPIAAAVFGVIVFVSSLFGDLIESLMKREAGVKDSSDLIPGHGGLLDRFDSYLFTGAIVYFYTRFVLPLYGL